MSRDYLTTHKNLSPIRRGFEKKREMINFHNYWFLIWPSYFNLSEIIRKRTVFSANKFTEVRHRVHNYWIWIHNEQTWRILKNLAWNKDQNNAKNCNFADEQGLQNNFNRKYLYNSKMVVKFLTKLSFDALKKNLRFTKYLLSEIIEKERSFLLINSLKLDIEYTIIGYE
jgi:hypothetical protein